FPIILHLLKWVLLSGLLRKEIFLLALITQNLQFPGWTGFMALIQLKHARKPTMVVRRYVRLGRAILRSSLLGTVKRFGILSIPTIMALIFPGIFLFLLTRCTPITLPLVITTALTLCKLCGKKLLEQCGYLPRLEK